MVRLFWTFIGFFSLSWAMELVESSGRIDFQKPGSLEWFPLQGRTKAGNNEVYRVQARSKLVFQDSAGLQVALHGPGQVRVNQILDPNGGTPTQILGELRGLFHVRWNGAGLSPDRFICNNVALHSFRGPGRFFCGEDSLTLIVWMESDGQMTAQRGEAYSVRVEAGRVWRMRTLEGKTEDQFVDSAWAGAYLRDRFGDAAPQERKQGRVRLVWNNSASVPTGTNWNIGPFLGESLRKLKGVVFTEDTLAWTVHAFIEQFHAQQEEGTWKLDIRIRFDLENREMPLQNRTVIFEKHESVPDLSPNRFGLLRLLPMEHSNQRIETSRLGKLSQELAEYFSREIVNPFQREGF